MLVHEKILGIKELGVLIQGIKVWLLALSSVILKLINNSLRENKENHNCDRGLDM